jgi:hypothetical protein
MLPEVIDSLVKILDRIKVTFEIGGNREEFMTLLLNVRYLILVLEA